MKIVVFDLDETLGYFTELSIFWDCLKNYVSITNSPSLTQTDFNNILDLFHEFLRPNIINILKYLKEQKTKNECHKMMIYTNNNGSKQWASQIISYFESKINYKLIDQIIAAFKVNGQHVEICRTTHSKTHKDFIRCTRLPMNAEICFLDDSFYPGMVHDNIYYINLKPYYYDLKFDNMITKFKLSNISNKFMLKENFDSLMRKEYNKYNYMYIEKNENEHEIDKIIGKQILIQLQDFFKKTNTNKKIQKPTHKTKKHKIKKNVTKKTH